MKTLRLYMPQWQGGNLTVAKLMTTNNPKLRTIIPSRMRPDAPILTEGKRELEKVGLGERMFVPELRTLYEY